MNPRAGKLIAAGALVAGTVAVLPGPASAAESGPSTRSVAPLTWTDCGTKTYPTLQCATLRVPLNHDDPAGRKISLALTRVAHTAATYQGPLLVNPGGPGGSGRGLAGYVAASLPANVAAQYDVIGFDPRGVGKSEPALDCLPGYFDPVRPDSVPPGAKGEKVNLQRARTFAKACGDKYADLLPYIDTISTARDMDAVRRALGVPRINYLGYSYGTYLGSVYARLYPERVRRLVLDSVVDPRGVWYDDNIGQNYAFDARHKAFMAWVARNDATYRLGTDPDAVEAAWYRMRDEALARPVGGKVGASELEDTFLPGGYYNGYWPEFAAAFSAYAVDHDSAPLLKAYEAHGAADAATDNGYSVYTSVQCRDARWPARWSVWRKDAWDVYAKARFYTWNNTWYNAPCAFWPVPSLTPPDVTNDQLPPTLFLQATNDAATPFEGAVALHRMVRRSSLVVEQGGGNHGVTLAGNTCMDQYLIAYLTTGEVPRGAEGAEADAVCETLPDPVPKPVKTPAPAKQGAAGSESSPAGASQTGSPSTESSPAGPSQAGSSQAAPGVTLHGLLGHER
ncbi:alpha/beta hydrolase [Streptomyces sp. NPDC048718]|uniref:alpha/beta hydrolase n=1 Tax=Streptomyces sp. NPDC048718 TaxID=3365587 RepID=UPI003715CF9E